MNAQRELVVLSHLRWTFVWQRPQHLISRLGRDARTFFVEEPVAAAVGEPRLVTETHDGIVRAWLEVPGPPGHRGFDDPAAAAYADLLLELLGGVHARRTVWLYTPIALPVAARLRPSQLVYDVMDDLASFKDASPEQRLRHKQALRAADLVFTGGRSLHAGVRDAAPGRTFLFPSGVEPEHYERARALRRRRERPVAGYVGVIDERLDLELVAGLAEALADWDIDMVGPVVKIDPSTLPRRANIRYPGMQPYERLPRVMGGFDVALMPFALNQATRSISPTKTLEYLAAGLPVVSTPVADVVTSFGDVVEIQDDAQGFAAACRRVHAHSIERRDAKVRPLLHLNRWDTIATRMRRLMDQAESGLALVDDAAPAVPERSATGSGGVA